MEKSKIQWTDHTFNPWIGCTKVHAGCKNCYAEELMANRYKRVEWGDGGTRSRTKDWAKPRQWQKRCREQQKRERVFCASLADVFEDRDELKFWRRDLWHLIVDCPNLDWLLLTKRPQNIRDFWYPTAQENPYGVRHNVWLGTSVSDQATADEWIPRLVENRELSPVLFLSVEPIVGPVDLNRHLDHIDWVIIGGESGHGARPCALEWLMQVVDQCQRAGVSCFVKQWGANPVISNVNLFEEEDIPYAFCECDPNFGACSTGVKLKNKKGDVLEEMPPAVRVREWPLVA